MVCFLTSLPFVPNETSLNRANGFCDELKACISEDRNALFICSDPNSHEITDGFSNALKCAFEDEGFTFSRYDVLDGRNKASAAQLVREAEVIILGGGHVPTQNRFFAEIGLKELLRGFDGVLIGISAGSMNSAEVVYAHPELEGEAIDPEYKRFLTGLGLTKKMFLPHYQEIKEDTLDGLRVFEDIAYPDSMGREFYAIVDGTYLLIRGGKEELRGEAYLIKDGTISALNSEAL